VKQADQLHVMAAKSFGATDREIFFKIVLPAAVPSLAGGLRLGMGHGLIGVIVGELFGSDAGLGFRMNYAASVLDVPNYFAGLVLVVVIGVTSSELLRWAEARTSRWRS
jgi:NitT/TauT family transport system permease protein